MPRCTSGCALAMYCSLVRSHSCKCDIQEQLLLGLSARYTCEYVIEHILNSERVEADYAWASLHLLAHLLNQRKIHRAYVTQVLSDDHIRTQILHCRSCVWGCGLRRSTCSALLQQEAARLIDRFWTLIMPTTEHDEWYSLVLWHLGHEVGECDMLQGLRRIHPVRWGAKNGILWEAQDWRRLKAIACRQTWAHGIVHLGARLELILGWGQDGAFLNVDWVIAFMRSSDQ